MVFVKKKKAVRPSLRCQNEGKCKCQQISSQLSSTVGLLMLNGLEFLPTAAVGSH